MLFGFLIVFIALFVVLVIGGIVFYQVYRRRRALARGLIELDYDNESGGYKGVPQMTDVFFDEKSNSTALGELGWRDLQPLSAVGTLNSQREAAPKERPSAARTSSLRTLMPFRRSQSSFPVPEDDPPQEAVQISFIVAMPSPSHRSREVSHRHSDDLSSQDLEKAVWQEREFAIGTCATPLSSPT